MATSAYQIEGAVKQDGRGASIWDTYAHTRGKIKDGRNADIANDHYRRYRDDVKLMQDLGVKAYRFSIAWPRIFPDGAGQPNTKGIDFYSRLVDTLHEAGIEPFATLYHWDLPQALQNKGGWQSRGTARAFADYAGCARGQSSAVWRGSATSPINEFFSFVDVGHRGIDTVVDGKKTRIELAPGLRLSNARLNQVRHHAVLAHGLSVQAIRANGTPGTKCGPADNLGTAVPAIETPDNIKAAETATREMNAGYLTVILEGKYTDAYLAGAGKDAPKFTEEVFCRVDLLADRFHRPQCLSARDVCGGFRTAFRISAGQVQQVASENAFGVAPAGPRSDVLGSAAGAVAVECKRDLHHRERLRGERRDGGRRKRRRFRPHHVPAQPPRRHLQAWRPLEGLPVRGYFHWSLMDNFEWSDGFANRFGLVYVDYKTQKRTPKLSAEYFKEAIAKNAVV